MSQLLIWFRLHAKTLQYRIGNGFIFIEGGYWWVWLQKLHLNYFIVGLFVMAYLVRLPIYLGLFNQLLFFWIRDLFKEINVLFLLRSKIWRERSCILRLNFRSSVTAAWPWSTRRRTKWPRSSPASPSHWRRHCRRRRKSEMPNHRHLTGLILSE